MFHRPCRRAWYIGGMKIKHVDHVGIVVNDMEAAKGFFITLGFKDAGEGTVEGDWVGRIIGLKDVKSDVAMLQAPDGQLNIELSKFQNPAAVGDGAAPSNTYGLRHMAFQVEDLDTIVETLKSKGTELVGSVETYGNSWKLCYVHGPEGILIELAEQL
jgi:catechol 2,3-dioxygenase-like lactoylglutathione lyase family enzyme